jgi:short-subunit dehydrogenase
MLAELGFNLILVSRNKDKVNRKSKELLERFPKIKI